MSYLPIEQYGVIGDLHTAALVGKNGSIDFLCFPSFDSPSVFAALLDDERGGSFRIAPVLEDARQDQIYLPDTNVLISRFLSDEGVAEVSDFMPTEDGQRHRVVRRAKTVRGEVHFRMVCRPAFDYGRCAHEATRSPEGVLFTSEQLSLCLRTSAEVSVRDGAAVAEFVLRAGESVAFVLEEAQSDSPAARPDFVSEAFKDTVDYWRRWTGRSTYQGRWRETVNRSALVLKMLTYRPEGTIVAAPTFGLPEAMGGERNWDYRYAWIRDASFTLYALSRLGYTEESASFMRWLEHRSADLGEDDLLQVMYGLRGERDLSEQTLPHLEGYRGSSPVRIGNGAADQLQLDIYGALMDAVYLYNKYGQPISYDLWTQLVRLIDWVCEHWQQPDHGIWEVRGGKHPFLYSRLMSWVAIDRGYRLAQKRSFPAPLKRWLEARNELHHHIFDTFWDDDLEAFVQYQGAKTLDASCLLMPLVKFISPTDPRWLKTLRAVETHLVEDSLVKRYNTGRAAPDGLEGEEGTFNMCSFWYIECLSRAGELDKARFLFEKMLSYANHVGLYSEELGRRGEHLGNFPQAFTHMALISAAFDLDRRLRARA
ncbi:MAG: glycoside hydrolase family 15 protein [Trueperaceae bacterium]|nr:glycoside hydrolase family 15 protein [Trueperaceae bacterium]